MLGIPGRLPGAAVKLGAVQRGGSLLALNGMGEERRSHREDRSWVSTCWQPLVSLFLPLPVS